MTILVSSMSAIHQVAGMEQYSLSNRYVVEAAGNLSQLYGSDHLISAVCPGFVDTPMLYKNGVHMKPPGTMSPEYVAEVAINETLKNKVVIIPGRRNRVLSWGLKSVEGTGIDSLLRTAQEVLFESVQAQSGGPPSCKSFFRNVVLAMIKRSKK